MKKLAISMKKVKCFERLPPPPFRGAVLFDQRISFDDLDALMHVIASTGIAHKMRTHASLRPDALSRLLIN